MASVAGAVGIGTGFQLGLENARQRRIQDQQLAQQNEQNQLSLADAKFRMGRERIAAQRQDQQYTQQQADLQRRAQTEGLHTLIQSLRAGVDPQYAFARYNQVGADKLDPNQSTYDPNTGHVRLVSTTYRGRGFEGNLSQLGAAIGLQPAAPIKLGKDDRLIDPTTHQTIVGPEPGSDSSNKLIATDKPIYDPATKTWIQPPGGEGGTEGRKISTYNPESVQKDIRSGIVLAHGGQTGEIEELTDPDVRDLVAYESSLADSMEGRFRKEVMDGRLTTGQIVNATLDATKDLPTENKLAQMAEDWRTEPTFVNRSHEDAAKWMAAERDKLHAQAVAKLNQNVQNLLGKTSKGHPSLFQKPDWAAKEITGPFLDQNNQPVQLTPGDTWEAKDDSGQSFVVRVGQDGHVYRVKGKQGSPKPASTSAVSAPPTPATPDVRSSLSDARRRAQFTY